MPTRNPSTASVRLATALDDPRAVGLGPYSGNLDAPRRQLDDEQHGVPLQARRGPHLHREEIRRGEDVPMAFQELMPRRPLLTLGSGLNPVLPEDGGDGPTPDVVTQVCEGSLNPRVAPLAILSRRPQPPHQTHSTLA